jgi:hypothetical protein
MWLRLYYFYIKYIRNEIVTTCNLLQNYFVNMLFKIFLLQNFESLKLLKNAQLESKYVSFNTLLISKYEKPSFHEHKNYNFQILI